MYLNLWTNLLHSYKILFLRFFKELILLSKFYIRFIEFTQNWVIYKFSMMYKRRVLSTNSFALCTLLQLRYFFLFFSLIFLFQRWLHFIIYIIYINFIAATRLNLWLVQNFLVCFVFIFSFSFLILRWIVLD